MKIWELDVDIKNFKSLQLKDNSKGKRKLFNELIEKEKSLSNILNNLEYTVIEGDVDGDLVQLWNGSGNTVLSQEALNVLNELLSDVEIIPMVCEQTAKKYYLLHFTKYYDVLDCQNSEFERLSSGLIASIEKHVFKEDLVKGLNIFKISINGRNRSAHTYVSDVFKKMVGKNNLTGFSFKEI